MSTERCTRAWQAEALEDGRLGDADAASFRRHLATCGACRGEVDALAQLQAAAARLPELSSTPLEHRRLRQELLRRAHAAGAQAPRAPKLLWLTAGAVALAAAVAVVAWPHPVMSPAPQPRAMPLPRAAPEYVATTSSDAVVRTLDGGAALRLSLERGELGLTVSPLRSDQRFIVQLPDGELEIKGTRFTVAADGARTTSVRVFEGRVALRLRDHSPLLLNAGDSFPAPVSTPAVIQPPPASTPLPAKRAAEPQAPEAPEAIADPALTERPPPESTFARAMTAFQAGDFGHADTLFEQFEREQPSDSRVEDALFLRAVARARRGDEAGARAIARAYLERFPNGLRKPDAERLAR